MDPSCFSGDFLPLCTFFPLAVGQGIRRTHLVGTTLSDAYP